MKLCVRCLLDINFVKSEVGCKAWYSLFQIQTRQGKITPITFLHNIVLDLLFSPKYLFKTSQIYSCTHKCPTRTNLDKLELTEQLTHSQQISLQAPSLNRTFASVTLLSVNLKITKLLKFNDITHMLLALTNQIIQISYIK